MIANQYLIQIALFEMSMLLIDCTTRSFIPSRDMSFLTTKEENQIITAFPFPQYLIKCHCMTKAKLIFSMRVHTKHAMLVGRSTQIVCLIAEKNIVENQHRRKHMKMHRKFPCVFGDISFRRFCFRRRAYIPTWI